MELARFLTLLRFNDRAECGKGTELHEGGTPHKKMYIQREGIDTTHTFMMGGTIGVEKKHMLGGGDTCGVV